MSKWFNIFDIWNFEKPLECFQKHVATAENEAVYFLWTCKIVISKFDIIEKELRS